MAPRTRANTSLGNDSLALTLAHLPDGALEHALGFLDFRERCVMGWRLL